jgi:lipopolysaccharide/colanic/teichoic acid biosynthesis glycosyltransferase
MLKRLFDVVASGIGLVVLSPVLLFLAIWIKLDSNGPVFYRQIRVGKGNNDFKLFKFRSMYVDADKKGQLTVGNRDPRITNSGYFIRKYKLDELPQLINVFLGDMSLVGPRPEVRKYVEMYTQLQKKVLEVKPGITDIASIEYADENELLANAEDPEKFYIEHIMPDKLNLNLQYMQKQSLWYDIGLILKTFSAIFRKK